MPALRLVERGAAVIRLGQAIVETRMDALLGTGTTQGEPRERPRHETMQTPVLKIVSMRSRRRPTPPDQRQGKPRHRDFSRVELPRAPRSQAIRRPRVSHEVTPDDSEFRPCSDQNPPANGDGVARVSGRGVAGPTTVPVSRPRPVLRAEMPQAVPRPSPRSRPLRSRQRPAARDRTLW